MTVMLLHTPAEPQTQGDTGKVMTDDREVAVVHVWIQGRLHRTAQHLPGERQGSP